MYSRLAKIFQRREIPEHTRTLYEKNKNLPDLVQGMDRLKTENEIEFNRLKEEILLLEEEEEQLIRQIKEGSEGRRKKFALQTIQRYRKQMENLERRMAIYDQNIMLHLTLIGKILDLEAMELKGVDEKTIEDILLDFETRLEHYLDTDVESLAQSTASQAFVTEQERELSALEKEILGEIKSTKEHPPLKQKERELLEE